jgi:GntR family transcriptional regulator
LEEDGLVERHRGKGTFYRGPSTRRRDAEPSQLLQSLIRNQPNGFARLISVQTVNAPMRIAENLRLDKDASVVAIDRLGIVDSEPILFIRAYLPHDVGSRLVYDEKRLTTSTLGELVEEFCQIKIQSVVQTIAATLADPSYSTHLGIDVGAPVLEGERTYRDDTGRPVIFSDAFYRADRHRFVVNLDASDVPHMV